MPAWHVFADYVEALVELNRRKKDGARSRKYTTLACAVAYRFLMKQYDKESLQRASKTDGTKSQCAYKIINKLTHLEKNTLKEYNKNNQKQVNLFIDVEQEAWGMENPVDAAKHILTAIKDDDMHKDFTIERRGRIID